MFLKLSELNVQKQATDTPLLPHPSSENSMSSEGQTYNRNPDLRRSAAHTRVWKDVRGPFCSSQGSSCLLTHFHREALLEDVLITALTKQASVRREESQAFGVNREY